MSLMHLLSRKMSRRDALTALYSAGATIIVSNSLYWRVMNPLFSDADVGAAGAQPTPSSLSPADDAAASGVRAQVALLREHVRSNGSSATIDSLKYVEMEWKGENGYAAGQVLAFSDADDVAIIYKDGVAHQLIGALDRKGDGVADDFLALRGGYSPENTFDMSQTLVHVQADYAYMPHDPMKLLPKDSAKEGFDAAVADAFNHLVAKK